MRTTKRKSSPGRQPAKGAGKACRPSRAQVVTWCRRKADRQSIPLFLFLHFTSAVQSPYFKSLQPTDRTAEVREDVVGKPQVGSVVKRLQILRKQETIYTPTKAVAWVLTVQVSALVCGYTDKTDMQCRTSPSPRDFCRSRMPSSA